MAITTSVCTGGTNSHSESAENMNAHATDFVSEGVVGAITNTSGVSPATGAFAVNAQGTPDMTVAVTQGIAYVTGTPTGGNSQTFRVNMDASQNVTISANSSGSTKYDWVYIKLDATYMQNPDVSAQSVASLTTSRSTSSSTDDGSPPTYGYLIAVVTVTNGAASITNSNITDSRGNCTLNSPYMTNNSSSMAGSVVQVVATTYAAVATGTTILPADDTIPQITEGDQYMTQSITPKSSTNLLVIEAVLVMSRSVLGNIICALFQDSTTNALAVTSTYQVTPNGMVSVPLRYTMTAGTASATTFRIRAGGEGAGTNTFNGSGGGRYFGAIAKSSIKITEIKV